MQNAQIPAPTHFSPWQTSKTNTKKRASIHPNDPCVFAFLRGGRGVGARLAIAMRYFFVIWLVKHRFHLIGQLNSVRSTSIGDDVE